MMYIAIQSHEYRKYEHLIDSYLRLRKRVFYDTLNWNIPVTGDLEQDKYDAFHPVYLLWCDDACTRLYGGIRLLPTTGPTLLNDVFRRTYSQDADLCAPGIWEGTRMCIDEELIAAAFPHLAPHTAFGLLLLALCECALENGIDTLISNYEPQMKRIYKRAGLEVDELGRAEGYGRYPVCCAAFEVSTRVRDAMRQKLGITTPIFSARTHIGILENANLAA